MKNVVANKKKIKHKWYNILIQLSMLFITSINRILQNKIITKIHKQIVNNDIPY